MKLRRAFLFPILIGILALSGCEDEGIGLVSKPSSVSHDSVQSEEDQHGVQAGGTKTNTTGDDKTKQGEEEQPLDDVGTPVTVVEEEEPEVSTVYFKLSFIKRNDANYICVSYDNDPFLSSYNFSYYTLNDSETRLTEYKKDTYEDKEVYLINVKEEEKTTNYTINFYNKKNVQYGKSNLVVQLREKVNYSSFLAVSFTAIQVRFISMGYAISNGFKNFIFWLSNLFNPSSIRF